MTFSRPSTQNNVAGYINYKGEIPSSPQNYIDNSIPNCLDKANGDTITGTVNVTGSVNVTTGSFGIGSAAVVSITLGSSAAVLFDSGSSLLTASGSTTEFSGSLTINTLLNLNGGITFSETDLNTIITQTTNTSSYGNQLQIIAQSTSAAGYDGGILTLSSGSGTVDGGEVEISGGAGQTFGGAIVIQGGIGQSGTGGAVSIIGGQGSGQSGTVTINSGVGTNPSVNIGSVALGALLSLGAGGLQLGYTSIGGTIISNISLSITQASYPLIDLSGVTLDGSYNLSFPSGVGPCIYFINMHGLTWNGHSLNVYVGSVQADPVIPGDFGGLLNSNGPNMQMLIVAPNDHSSLIYQYT